MFLIVNHSLWPTFKKFKNGLKTEKFAPIATLSYDEGEQVH